jgi:hypothetical protein
MTGEMREADPVETAAEMSASRAGLASSVNGSGAIVAAADSLGEDPSRQRFSKLRGLEGTGGNNNRMKMSRLSV